MVCVQKLQIKDWRNSTKTRKNNEPLAPFCTFNLASMRSRSTEEKGKVVSLAILSPHAKSPWREEILQVGWNLG